MITHTKQDKNKHTKDRKIMKSWHIEQRNNAM